MRSDASRQCALICGLGLKNPARRKCELSAVMTARLFVLLHTVPLRLTATEQLGILGLPLLSTKLREREGKWPVFPVIFRTGFDAVQEHRSCQDAPAICCPGCYRLGAGVFYFLGVGQLRHHLVL